MNRSLVASLVTWVILAGVVAVTPIIAAADETPATTAATEYHYRTTITPVYGSQYPITGRLDLQIFPSGIVRGYYWWAFQKQYIPVTGGRDGNYIWFNIGPSQYDLGLGAGPGGTLHVVANMGSDNGFSGQVYPEYAASLSGDETLNAASPQPTANDQYLFFAKPIENSTSY